MEKWLNLYWIKALILNELIIQNFDKSFSNISAKEFVKLLVDNLNLKKIIVGYTHRFGKNRSADIRVLKEFSLKYNFEVLEIKAFEVEKIKISSTKIRNAINDGNIDVCNEFLLSMKKWYKNILIISHIDVIKDTVDNIMEITRNGIDSKVTF